MDLHGRDKGNQLEALWWLYWLSQHQDTRVQPRTGSLGSPRCRVLKKKRSMQQFSEHLLLFIQSRQIYFPQKVYACWLHSGGDVQRRELPQSNRICHTQKFSGHRGYPAVASWWMAVYGFISMWRNNFGGREREREKKKDISPDHLIPSGSSHGSLLYDGINRTDKQPRKQAISV